MLSKEAVSIYILQTAVKKKVTPYVSIISRFLNITRFIEKKI